MNHAILIMVHKNPEQVLRLVRYFPTESCVCFIHVDAKADFSIDQLKETLAKSERNYEILQERVSGVLANWSLVEVELALLRAAKNYEARKNIHFDYFRLLSGQDYPIRPFDVYESFLMDTYPRDYIGLDYIESNNHVADKFARWRLPGPRQYVADHGLAHSVVEKILVGIAHVGEVIWTKLRGTPQIVMEKRNLIPAGGPSWWTITDKFASYVLEDDEKHAMIRKILKNTATPEESYFQTLYVNSGIFHPTGHMYNMTIGKYNAQGHTTFWTADEYEQLIQSDCYFARKFDPSVDDVILRMLDQTIYQ